MHSPLLTLPQRPFCLGAGAGACRWGFSGTGFPQLLLELPEGHWPSTLDGRPSPAAATRTSAIPARFPEIPRFPCGSRISKKPKPRPRPSGAAPQYPEWGLGPAQVGWSLLGCLARPSPPAEPGWLLQPSGSAHPRLPQDSFESSPSRRGCSGLRSVPSGLPLQQSRGGRHLWAPYCVPATQWG